MSARNVIYRGLAAGVTGAATIEAFLLVVFGALHIPLIHLNQSDAAHLLGKAAYSGGPASATLGLVLHLIVSTCWGLLAAAMFGRYPALARRPIVFGLLFGFVVMVVMNWGVLAVSREPLAPMPPWFIVILVAAHTLFFGVPVALTSRVGLASEA